MNLFDISIPHMNRIASQALVWLDKAQAFAEAKKFDVGVLLTARIAPDQWHFTRQIQSIAAGPLRLAAQLRGQPIPDYVDLEPTLAAVRARLEETRAQVSRLRSQDFDDAAARVIPLPFMPSKGMDAPAFVQQFALPNFYFHAATAYAILRHNGVDVGKIDFLGPIDIRDL